MGRGQLLFLMYGDCTTAGQQQELQPVGESWQRLQVTNDLP